MTTISSARARAACQAGVTLIEVALTILILSGGILTTLTVFTNSGHAAAVAQRYTVIASVAQRELEKIRPLPYDRLGLSGPVAASAAEAPLSGAAATEQMVDGGVVAPGPEPFAVQGVTGRIYRYITWRPQPCPVLQGKVVEDVSQVLGSAVSEVAAAVSNLCPGNQQTKRITIVVKADVVGRLGPRLPFRLSTVAVDPESTLLSSGNFQGLRVNAAPVTDVLTGGQAPAPDTVYADVAPQDFHLYDTQCDQSTRQPVTANHPTHDTSLQGGTCTGSGQPDLMGLTPVPGAPTDLLYDYSDDITRPAAGGLVLMRDDRVGECQEHLTYTGAESGRRRSIHTWATPAPAATAETPPTGGRATLTFWTRTASTVTAAGRLCVVLRRESTGELVGTADYRLPAWPKDPTQLAIALDVAPVAIAPGDRLLLTVRVPQDSQADLHLLYDHPVYQSSLSVALLADRPFT